MSGLRHFRIIFGGKVHIERTKCKASKISLKFVSVDGEVGM